MAFSYLAEVFKIDAGMIMADATTTAPGAPGIRYSHNEHCVLLALANRANEKTGLCWPGYASIGRSVHLSRSAVVRALRNLKRMGLITVHPPTKGRVSNTYKLFLDRIKLTAEWAQEQSRGKVADESDSVTDPDTPTTSFNIEDDDDDI